MNKLVKLIAVLCAITMIFGSIPAMASAQDMPDLADQPEETVEDLSMAEPRNEINLAELISRDHADEPGVDVNEDEVELMASDVTVSGTVTLPVSAPEDGRIGVYLYNFKKDGNKVVSSGSSSAAYQIVNISKGKKSVKYSISVPKGSYKLAVRYFNGSGNVLNEMMYYQAKGLTPLSDGADEIVVSSSKTVNLTLEAAERHISGTITLDTPIASDGYAYVYAYSSNYSFSSYTSIPVKKGDKKIDYSLGVRKDVYNIEVSINGDYRYYGVTGEAVDYEGMCYINTVNRSYDNVDFTYSEDEYNDDYYGEVSAELTVNLNKETEADAWYYIRLEYEYYSSSYSMRPGAGVKSFKSNIWAEKDEWFAISIMDLTGLDSYYRTAPRYYYSEELGITPDRSLATEVTVDDILNGLEINYPESNSLTGTVYRNSSANSSDLPLYVFAEVGSERFFSYVTIEAGKDSASYSVDIPKRAAGKTANVYASLRGNGTNQCISKYGDSVTTDSYKGVDIYAPADAYKSYNGTVTLPVAAPKGGVVLDFYAEVYDEDEGYSSRETVATYYMPEGTKSLSYTIDAMDSDGTDATGWISMTSVDRRFSTSSSIEVDFKSENITLPYLDQTITGTVHMPDDEKYASGVTYEIYAQYTLPGSSSYNYSYSNFSILKGDSSADYFVYIPSGATLTRLNLYVQAAGTAPISSSSLYFDGEGTSDRYTNVSIPMTNGLSNVDFYLTRGKIITGTIFVPDDFTGEAYVWVETDEDSSNGIRITGPGEYPYTVTVSDYMDETMVYLYFSDEYICNYYTGETYYSSDGTTYLEDEAEYVYIEDEVTDGIDFELIKAKNISGTISFGAGAYVNGKIWGMIELYGDEFYVSQYLEFKGTNPISYSIGVPLDVDEEFELGIDISYGYDTQTNITEGYYCYTEDGSLSLDGYDIAYITIDPEGENIDLVIPAGYTVNGKIILPDDAVGKVESVDLEFRSVNSGRYFYFNQVNLSNDGSFTVALPPIKDSYIAELYPNFSSVSNMIREYYYYVDETESTTERYDASEFEVAGNTDSLVFFIDTGKLVSGKIIVPEGVTLPEYSRVYISASGTSKNVYLTGNETEFGIAVPRDMDTVTLYYYYGGDTDSIYDETLYLSENGPTTDYLKMADFELDETGLTGLVLPLVRNRCIIDVTAHRPAYADDSYYLSPYVYAVLDNGEEIRLNMSLYYGERSDSNTLTIPDLDAYADMEGFKLQYSVYNSGRYNDDGLVYYYEDMYVSSDGTYTQDKEQAAAYSFDDTKKIDFVVWDNSLLVDDAIKEGLVKIEISEAYIDLDEGVVRAIINTRNSYYQTYNTYNSTLILAEYDAEGSLVNVTRNVYQIDYSYYYNNDDERDEACVEFEIDYNADHTYKLFSWDNTGFMHPISKPVVVQVESGE